MCRVPAIVEEASKQQRAWVVVEQGRSIPRVGRCWQGDYGAGLGRETGVVSLWRLVSEQWIGEEGEAWKWVSLGVWYCEKVVVHVEWEGEKCWGLWRKQEMEQY